MFSEVDVSYLGKLHELHHDLQFFPERINIKKVKKLAANLYDKTECIIYMKKFKTRIKS